MWGGVGWGGCSNVLCLRYHRFSWVTTLHVMLHISVVHRWTHFMLRCTLLLYFCEHTSCYVAHFCCTWVTKLHVTLYTSVVLLWPNFMLRCTLLLSFGEHTSCYIAHFCCTSVNTLHVTLHTSVVLQWTYQQEWGWEVGKMGGEPIKLETWNFTDIKGQECLGASGWSDVYMDFKWRCLWRNLSSPASSQNWLFRCETDFWEWTTSGLICAQQRGGKASMSILLADWISEFFKFLRWTCSSAWQKQWLRWWHRAPEMRSSALSSNPSLTSDWPQAQQNAGEMSAGTMAQCLSDKLLRSYWWCTCGGSEWDRQHWELMIQVANVEDAIWSWSPPLLSEAYQIVY